MQFSSLKHYFQAHIERILFLVSFLLSVCAITYFVLHGNQNLGDYDAVARLNISRKIIDSLTPGVGQLGGIWLPFPQVLIIPFVTSDFLWHTGLAASIVSGAAFIIGAVYLYKTALLITKSVKASLLVWFLFVANLNILFLQTMALSEMFFLSGLIMVLYFLTKWMEDHTLINFLGAGLALTVITLTRYEGYFVFVGAVLVVFIECFRLYRRNNLQKLEGMMLLFLTVAGFGIFLWCMYCFLFYNDFLYWLHLYTAGKQQVSTAAAPVTAAEIKAYHADQKTLLTSLNIYSQAIMAMNGKVIAGLSLFGLVPMLVIAFKRFRNKHSIGPILPVMVISIVLFAFLVYGYLRGFIPPIHFPPVLIPFASRKSFTIYSDSNIRYGIILAPCLVLLAGFFASRARILYYLVILLFGAQLYVNMIHPRLVQYYLPDLWPYTTLSQVPWFREHYTSGTILIGSGSHEDFMFQSGLPYKDFIYEGSRDYWTDSLNNPALHADWVIYDEKTLGDAVHNLMTARGHEVLVQRFQLVYDVNGFKVFHKIR